MAITPKQRNIAYRCPECGTAVLGIIGKFALHANMLRLKCSCEGDFALDINIAGDNKIRLSVPCIFCKQNHNYVVSESLFFDKDLFLLNCRYSGMDIAFIGEESNISSELSRTERELIELLKNLEAEELSDIQPADMNEDEILPDPAVYDTMRFIIKDLEDSGRIKCPCGNGKYDLRFTDGGVEVYCEVCGASHTFLASSPSIAEEYLTLDEITLN